MADATHTLRRFLAAVRRRAVLLRVIERSALGLLGGLLLAMLLIGGLWLADRPVDGVLPLAAAIGTACGFIWAVSRLPTHLDAAMLADQQLQLDDLLGTAAAMLSGPAASDPWAATIVQIADARCRTLRPRDLVLRRLGARVWGGLGLAMAMALTLTALAGNAAHSLAANTVAPPASVTAPPAVDRPLMVLADQGIRVKASASASGDDQPDASRVGSEQPIAGPATQNTASRNTSQGGATGTDGGGASGFGQTKTPGSTQPATPDPTVPATTRPATSPAGIAAAAGAGSGQATGPATREVGRTGAGQTGSAAVPPWQSADWAKDVRNAREQLDAGQVPAAYRDLVRKYFDVK